MTTTINFNPNRALTSNITAAAGALAYFYQTGTTVLKTVYSDKDLTIPHPSPLVANSVGIFPTVYIDDAAGTATKAVVRTSAGVTLYTVDPCVSDASLSNLELANAATSGTPHFDDQAEAEAATIPESAETIIVGEKIYRKTGPNPYTKSAFQDTNGNWWTSIFVATTGPVEVWVAWGQSEMRGVTNSPAAIGGDRKARNNVLSYVRGTTIAGVPDGWYAVGPEDDAWPFASSLNAVGSAFYAAAADRAEEIGGVVCIVPYAIGGAESGLFLQGGSMWAGLQASWSAALAASLPGRGMSLNGMGKALADVMLIWQGSADADYKLGVGDAAADADDWVTRWRTILNSLEAPSGMSVPVIRDDLTKIIFFEMLHGATSGGGVGLGNPTDSRNRDLHKFLKYTSSKRHQIAIVPMAGVNNATTNPEVIGSPDNLHPNGAAYGEVSRRLSAVLKTFEATDRNDAVIENADGYTICYPDGTFESWSKELTAAAASTAAGGLFRSSYVVWDVPMPAGYEVDIVPNFAPCGCDTFPAFIGLHVRPADPVNRVQTYVLSTASVATAIKYRVSARGLWKRV